MKSGREHAPDAGRPTGPHIEDVGASFDVEHGRSLRRPRERSGVYLKFIRRLPCCKCGIDPCGEAAHIRMGSAKNNKRSTGIGEKPSDRYAIPLCHACHLDRPNALHNIGEATFFEQLNGDVFDLHDALYANRRNFAEARRITLRFLHGIM